MLRCGAMNIASTCLVQTGLHTVAMYCLVRAGSLVAAERKLDVVRQGSTAERAMLALGLVRPG